MLTIFVNDVFHKLAVLLCEKVKTQLIHLDLLIEEGVGIMKGGLIIFKGKYWSC